MQYHYILSFHGGKQGFCSRIINGFTNASIRKFLFPEAAANDKKIRNKTTRIIAKLRAHKLISKIPHSFRYKVTPKGIRIISSVLAVKNIALPDAMKAA